MIAFGPAAPTKHRVFGRLSLLFVAVLWACGGKVVSESPDEADASLNDSGGSTDSVEDRERDSRDLPDSDEDEPVDTDDPLSQIDPSTLAAGSSPCRQPAFAEVRSVTDGDTITVMTGRGEERVRLIGIDASEVDHDGTNDECWAEEATDFVRETLDGKGVWLTFDSECEDHFDRTLAYVHVGLGDRGFFQRTLLLEGWVSTFSVAPNTTYADQFEDDEQYAVAAGNGLWGACRR